MIDIILVDDESEKAQAIIGSLHELGISEGSVVHRTNAREARMLMRERAFDLAIIDLQLPEMLGATPKSNAGFELFDILLLDTNTKLPASIIFMTGKEDLLPDAERGAEDRGVQICFYRSGEEKWKKSFQHKVRYLLAQKKRNTSSYPNIEFAIITAMRSELEAVLALPYEWKAVRYSGNAVSYHHCSVTLENGETVSLVAASAFTKGMPSSAALATQMCLLFRPKYIVMLGICAGVKKHTSLGDVVIADPSWDWGSGKIAEDSAGQRVFLASPQQRPLNTHISQICIDLSKDPEIKKRIQHGWNGNLPQGKFDAKVGPMASGASVLANKSVIGEISGSNRDVVAVEMEAYAVMAAVEYAISPSPVAIAIKSVCDFADADKGDDWQNYAAYTSCAFFNELLKSGRI